MIFMVRDIFQYLNIKDDKIVYLIKSYVRIFSQPKLII